MISKCLQRYQGTFKDGKHARNKDIAWHFIEYCDFETGDIQRRKVELNILLREHQFVNEVQKNKCNERATIPQLLYACTDHLKKPYKYIIIRLSLIHI